MAIIERYSSSDVKWIDVIDPSSIEMEQLSKEYKLNEHVVFDCLQPEHLPKYEYDEDNDIHLLILRYYSLKEGEYPSRIQELTNKIAIFSTNKIVITIHIRETSFLDTLARRAVKLKFSRSELLSGIIWQALETFDDPANRLSDQLEEYEDKIMLKKTVTDVTEDLFYIKRHASLALKVLMLMLEPINNIQINPEEESLLRNIRDQHIKMHTLYSQVLDDVNNLLSISMSFAAQRTSEVMRILTLFSVFFMPLTFIVGIYGMNFEFMPELREKWGYPAVLILMAIITGIIFWWFKKKKWL